MDPTDQILMFWYFTSLSYCPFATAEHYGCADLFSDESHRSHLNVLLKTYPLILSYSARRYSCVDLILWIIPQCFVTNLPYHTVPFSGALRGSMFCYSPSLSFCPLQQGVTDMGTCFGMDPMDQILMLCH